MNSVSDKSFIDDTIDLDGNTFIRCKFERCIMRFNGTANFMTSDCITEGCQFALGGPASITIRQFRAMLGVGGAMGEHANYWLYDPAAETILRH
jgi:hypothetical protein